MSIPDPLRQAVRASAISLTQDGQEVPLGTSGWRLRFWLVSRSKTRWWGERYVQQELGLWLLDPHGALVASEYYPLQPEGTFADPECLRQALVALSDRLVLGNRKRDPLGLLIFAAVAHQHALLDAAEHAAHNLGQIRQEQALAETAQSWLSSLALPATS